MELVLLVILKEQSALRTRPGENSLILRFWFLWGITARANDLIEFERFVYKSQAFSPVRTCLAGGGAIVRLS